MKSLIFSILYLVFFSSLWATEELSSFKETESSPLEFFPKFKIGVELQESSHLCPWHGERSEFQNKEIFNVSVQVENSNKIRKLWSLVIDTSDIEFVTSPFPSDEEKKMRNLCMSSINKSITILKETLKGKNDDKILKIEDITGNEEKIREEIKIKKEEISTFEKELLELRKELNNKREKDTLITSFNNAYKILKKVQLEDVQKFLKEDVQKFLKENEQIIAENEQMSVFIKKHDSGIFGEKRDPIEEKDKKLNFLRDELRVLYDQELKYSQRKSEVTQKINVTFSDWIKDMENALLNLKLGYSPSFNLVKDKPLVLTKLYKEHEAFWEPRFSPQVTLQHPLSVAIPLYFYLFGENFEERKMISAIPNYDTYSKFLSRKKIHTDLCTSLNGLIFIHALTLSEISKSAKESDSEGLDLALKEYEESKQIDVKMWLPLMSRRAFSDMFNDIKNKGDKNKGNIVTQDFYSTQFKERISSGNGFFDEKIEEKFKNINYGQQFFEESGEIKDLRFLSSIIEESFYKKNKENIEKLLKLGIITTSMIRNFNDQVLINEKKLNSLFDSYFKKSIDSVQNSDERIGYGIEFSYQSQFNFSDKELTDNSREGYKIGYKYENQVYFKKYIGFDTFSPPWFLARDDSMGNMTRRATENSNIKDNEEIEKDYGEAIIEIRDLKAISLRLLKDRDLSEDKKLLEDPNLLKNDLNALFDDIRKFQNDATLKGSNIEF